MKPFAILLSILALSFPLVGRAAAPRPPAVVSETLPNGLRVLVRPLPTAPVVTTMMWYRVGSRDEPAGATGMAHFLEHLLFKGTKKLKKGEIDRLTYQNGGSNNAFTFNDYTAYEFNLPKRNWKVALGIEADRMRNTVFDVKEFESERLVVMEERRGAQDNPEERFSEQLNAMSFLVHPYRNPVIGWMEDLQRITRDQVFSFYQKYYVPANATLVITGDVEPREALAATRTAFAAVPRLPAPPHSSVSEPPQLGGRRLELALPTQVSRFQVIFPAVSRKSADLYPLEVLSLVLAQGRLSRVYQRLVEQEKSAADVGAYLGDYRDAGILALYANASEGASLEAIEKALWEELDRVVKEPVSTEELERAKNQFASSWIRGIETANDYASVLGEAAILGDHRFVDQVLGKIQAVTAADVQRTAAKYLRRDRANTGHLVPAAAPASTSASRSPSADPARRAGRSGVLPAPLARQASAPVPAAAPALPSFQPLKPLEHRLPNGMRLVLLENHNVPAVTLSARVLAGQYEEPAEKAGLANLTARMLDEGTRSRDYRRISAALEQVGASFTATAGREASFAELQALSRNVGDLLPLYAELLRDASFPADRLEQQRDQLLVELKEEEDDAVTVARKAFGALVYGSHPSGRPVSGTPESVRGITPEDLRSFHARYYRPERVTLVAVGDFQAPELLRKLTAAFQEWERGGPLREAARPGVQRQAELRTRRIPLDKTQTRIVLGHLGIRRNDPDFPALEVMDAILGEGVAGGFTARIPFQLRDVQGLAYTVGSSITSSAAGEPGVFIAAMGTEPKNEAKAIAGLLNEIRRIRTAPVTEAELREAINYLASSYVFDFQKNDQLAAYLHQVLAYGLGYDYRQKFVRDVARVTRADVLRVAKKYLDPQHYSLVVVGPGQKPEGTPRPVN